LLRAPGLAMIAEGQAAPSLVRLRDRQRIQAFALDEILQNRASRSHP
jgi:hypothetical protein